MGAEPACDPLPQGRRRADLPVPTPPVPLVPSRGGVPQPPENRRRRWKNRLFGWHKYCQILPRRRRSGQVEGRTPAHRRRCRRRPTAPLRGGLAARGRGSVAGRGIPRRARGERAGAHSDRLGGGGPFAVRPDGRVRCGNPRSAAEGAHLLPLFHAAASGDGRHPHRGAQRRAGGGDGARIERLALHRPGFREFPDGPAGSRSGGFSLREGISARQAAGGGRAGGLGRNGQYGLPQPRGQPRGDGFSSTIRRPCARWPKRSTGTAPPARVSIRRVGSVARCGAAWRGI